MTNEELGQAAQTIVEGLRKGDIKEVTFGRDSSVTMPVEGAFTEVVEPGAFKP